MEYPVHSRVHLNGQNTYNESGVLKESKCPDAAGPSLLTIEKSDNSLDLCIRALSEIHYYGQEVA